MALEVSMRFDPDNPGVVKFAPTPAELATGGEFQCQITSVALTPSPVTETRQATLCRSESDGVKPSKWALELEFFQDWIADPDSGLSWFLYDNDGKDVAFSVSYTDADPPVATGTCSIQAGAFLGAASGSLMATVSLPCQGKPVFTRPVAAPPLAATAEVDPDTGEPVEPVDPDAELAGAPAA